MAKTDPYMDVLDELRELTLKKRAGYSPGDDPFVNFRMTEMFKVPCKCGCGVATPIPPIFGIMIREMDKISRLASLLENPNNEQVGESIRDTMMDAGNYPLIGVAMTDADEAARLDLERGRSPLDAKSQQILDEIEAERQAREEPFIEEVVLTFDPEDTFDSSEMDDPDEDVACCERDCIDCYDADTCPAGCIGDHTRTEFKRP